MERCFTAAELTPTLTHNSSGFDERACLKCLLMSRAELHPGCESLVGSPQEEVWNAANTMLQEQDSTLLPAFYQGYRPLRLLHTVLWGLLQQSNEHRDLMNSAIHAKIGRLPLQLEWVSEVHCLAIACQKRVSAKNT